MTTTNLKAELFLRAYPHLEEIEGFTVFSKALTQARLDYSDESIDRIDVLLTKIHLKFGNTLPQFGEKDAEKNFLLTLAFYLGDYIAKRRQTSVQWYDYGQAKEKHLQGLPANPGITSLAVGLINNTLFLPLACLHARLLDQKKLSCKDFVQDYFERLSSTQKQDENIRCSDYLRRFFAGERFTGGVSFSDDLQQADLDFTMASIARLDAMLSDIRRRSKHTYVPFIQSTEGINFLRLTSFILCTTIARTGKFSMQWKDYEDTHLHLDDLPVQIETSLSCLIGNRFYFPIGLLTEILFDPKPNRTCQSYARNMLDQLGHSVMSVPIKRHPEKPADAMGDAFVVSPKLWLEAVEQTGTLIKTAMQRAVNGGTIPIAMMNRNNTFEPLEIPGVVESFDDTIERGEQKLRYNPEHNPYMAIMYDGYTTLATGKTDAITLEVRCYQGESLDLSIVIPYRAADTRAGFTILCPRITACSAEEKHFPNLFKAFNDGIDNAKPSEFIWDSYLKEDT